jgi:hypothetical protein
MRTHCEELDKLVNKFKWSHTQYQVFSEINTIHKYCDMHAVGQQSTVETLFITVAQQRNNGSDQRFLCGLTPACTQQSKELLFSTGSVPRPMQQWVFFCGLFTGYIAGQLVKELVMTSDGKGCHKSWLQQLEPRSSGQEKRLSCCEL